jgi:hypothetical protein
LVRNGRTRRIRCGDCRSAGDDDDNDREERPEKSGIRS